MVEGKPIIVNGVGDKTRDFVYVDDVVRANMFAMAHPRGNLFNIGTGRQTTINALYRKLKKLTGYELPERHGPNLVGEVTRSALSFKKARALLRLYDGTGRPSKYQSCPLGYF